MAGSGADRQAEAAEDQAADMALSPWPNAGTMARTNAIKTLQQAVGGATVGVINPVFEGQKTLTAAEETAAANARANALGEAAAGHGGTLCSGRAASAER